MLTNAKRLQSALGLGLNNNHAQVTVTRFVTLYVTFFVWPSVTITSTLRHVRMVIAADRNLILLIDESKAKGEVISIALQKQKDF